MEPISTLFVRLFGPMFRYFSNTMSQRTAFRSGLFCRAVLAAFLFLVVSTSAQADKYYVNDNDTSGDVHTTAVGNDGNSGGPSDPFATIPYAVDQASSGDGTVGDEGSYQEGPLAHGSLPPVIDINRIFEGKPGWCKPRNDRKKSPSLVTTSLTKTPFQS